MYNWKKYIGIISLYRLSNLRLKIPGTYRKIISRPAQLSWRWIVDNAPELAGERVASVDSAACSSARECTDAHVGRDNLQERPQLPPEETSGSTECTAGGRSLELSFSLPTASYATMLLRELMKRMPSPPQS